MKFTLAFLTGMLFALLCAHPVVAEQHSSVFATASGHDLFVVAPDGVVYKNFREFGTVVGARVTGIRTIGGRVILETPVVELCIGTAGEMSVESITQGALPFGLVLRGFNPSNLRRPEL